ncbi:STAS domain-containing protein [Streptomyces sp. NBC_00448]|uniref:STAS domain-containing protein n=1 Tax=Streptomyces sp. NBC_00448 TaxID=2903652 RepID=UPI002E1C9083
MTMTPPAHLRLTTVDTEDTVRIELHGDLDYDNADRLVAAVTAKLAEHPHLDDLHLHCAELGTVDTMGLSALLMIRRRTGEAGVRLHLDERGTGLDRLLDITGTLEHLTAPVAGTDETGAGETPVTNGEATMPRSAGPDATP